MREALSAHVSPAAGPGCQASCAAVVIFSSPLPNASRSLSPASQWWAWARGQCRDQYRQCRPISDPALMALPKASCASSWPAAAKAFTMICILQRPAALLVNRPPN